MKFENGLTGQTQARIDFAGVQQQWNDPDGLANCSRARILLRNFDIACHFFWEGDIENDITPRAFRSAEDHEALLGYMQAVANTLQKPVRLTPENSEEEVLLEGLAH